MQLDVTRILAEQVGGDIRVDVGSDRGGGPEGFAGADDAFIGVNAKPQQKRKFSEFERLDRRHFHVRLRRKRSAVIPTDRQTARSFTRLSWNTRPWYRCHPCRFQASEAPA